MVTEKNKIEIGKKKSAISSSSFAERIRQEHNIKITDAKKIVKTMMTMIEEGLIEGNPITLSRIGTLYVAKQPKRLSINPRTKEKLMLSERNLLKFKKSVIIDKLLNTDNPKSYERITEKEVDEYKRNKQKP